MDATQLHSTDGPSRMCLGTDNFGSRTPPATAWQLLDQFVEAGGTWVDTANAYACWAPGCRGGESERVIGSWLARRPRSEIRVVTKLGFAFADTPAGLREVDLVRECEQSLRRLGTETIDLYLAHCDDPGLAVPEILAGFEQLVAAGKVRQVGLSNWTYGRLVEAFAGSSPAHPVALEYRYTYLQPRPAADFDGQVHLSAGMIELARQHGAAVMAYSVLLNGTYARPERPLPDAYASVASTARLAALRGVAEDLGATPSQVVISWLLHREPAIVPIVAASSCDQLAENLAGTLLRLTVQQRAALDQAGRDEPSGKEPDHDRA